MLQIDNIYDIFQIKFSDDGTTWNFITGTESLDITSIIGDSTTLFLGTSDNGLWKYEIESGNITQISDTKGKKINPNSLFISNDNKNLFFEIENEGLFELLNLNPKSLYQLKGKNGFITFTDNVKSIKETKSDILLLWQIQIFSRLHRSNIYI